MTVSLAAAHTNYCHTTAHTFTCSTYAFTFPYIFILQFIPYTILYYICELSCIYCIYLIYSVFVSHLQLYICSIYFAYSNCCTCSTVNVSCILISHCSYSQSILFIPTPYCLSYILATVHMHITLP